MDETVEAKVGSGDTNDGKNDSLKLLQDPFLLAAMQPAHHEVHDFLSELPNSVQRRVKALKKIQLDALQIEAEFFKQVHELECVYAEKMKPLSDKRRDVISGLYEPTQAECEFPLDDQESELTKDLETKATLNGPGKEKEGESTPEEDNVKGIPDFWLTLFRNVELLSDMVQEHDEPILKALQDIEVKISKDPMAFSVIFTFAPNEYFTNTVLTKDYVLKCEPNSEDPFEFDGPEIVNCKGCHIDWKSGKNVTKKFIKKKQKHKQRGSTRFVTREVKADSFFNFFEPPVIPEGTAEDDIDEDTRELMNTDFEIGQILRERIIPRAVLYFTGEAHDDDDDESFDEEGDEDDEFDEESSEDEDTLKNKGMA